MKLRFLLLASGLVDAGGAQAQVLGTSQAATVEQRLAEDLGVDRLRNALVLPAADARNTVSLLQTGVGNATTVNQTSTGIAPNQAALLQAGAGNAISLNQMGTRNQTDFSQTGTGNQATLRQAGVTNTVYGRVAGNGNGLDVSQDGTGNEYSTQLTGSHGRYTIEQLGNNNSLTQRETSTSPATPLPGYSVQQQGSGIHLTIEQGKAFP